MRDFDPLVSVVVSAAPFVSIAYALGALYGIFGFGDRAMAQSEGEVDSNIEERLLER